MKPTRRKREEDLVQVAHGLLWRSIGSKYLSSSHYPRLHLSRSKSLLQSSNSFSQLGSLCGSVQPCVVRVVVELIGDSL